MRERLLAHGFREEFLGDDRPPVTHYHLAGDDAGFYVEFLTPLVGGEFTRGGDRDVTTPIAGVSAQKLRHLDVLLISPWIVTPQARAAHRSVLIANPVSYLAQKLLISARRKPGERAKDIVYIHDTLSLFGGSLTELHDIWINDVTAAAKALGVSWRGGAQAGRWREPRNGVTMAPRNPACRFPLPPSPTLFDLVHMEDELRAIFGRDVDLVTRRAVERGTNAWRRQAILGSLAHVALAS